jgi:hypothetical protein
MIDLTMSDSEAARFWPKVSGAGTDDCWLWVAAKTNGYGRFALRKCAVAMAHRVAYHNLVGPIPDGLVLDHLCRVPECVNPAHLEPVTIGENVMRGETRPALQAAQTSCMRGHEFTPENTYTWRTRRYCRACHVRRQRERRGAA